MLVDSERPDEPGDDGDERHTALYDPDTVFPVTGIGGDNVPSVLKKSGEAGAGDAAGSDGINAQLYSQREKTRVAPKLTSDAVRRIADRVERSAGRKV